MMINYAEKHSTGNCAGCHKVDAPEGQCLCDGCGEEAESAFGISDEEEAALWACHDAHEQRQRWKALRAIFRITSAERAYCTWWMEAYARFVCACALLFNRLHHGRDGTESHQYETVASWDCRPEYAGWSGMFVSVHLKAWRAHVFSDGDWNM